MKERKIVRSDFNEYDVIIDYSYCKLTDFYCVLADKKVGYMSGVYGWNCDIFRLNVNGLTIYLSEGYRPISKNKNKYMKEEILRKQIKDCLINLKELAKES